MKRRLIVAEDDTYQRALFKEYIESLMEDLEVDDVSNGQSLVKKVRENDYLMVITDYSMEPGMNGLSAIEEIRKFNKTIPIYMVSGASGESLKILAMDVGANG